MVSIFKIRLSVLALQKIAIGTISVWLSCIKCIPNEVCVTDTGRFNGFVINRICEEAIEIWVIFETRFKKNAL